MDSGTKKGKEKTVIVKAYEPLQWKQIWLLIGAMIIFFKMLEFLFVGFRKSTFGLHCIWGEPDKI